MSGKVRTLVPYFVPGKGDTVNESLSHYATTTPKSSPSSVSVHVREWDHADGYFKDAVHLVHDHHQQEQPTLQQPVVTQTPRLLTPAEIRHARQKALAESPSRNHDKSKSPRNIKSLDQSHKSSPPPNSPSSHSPSSTTPESKFETPPGKQRPFAGSTFETASPPPSGLPIPGFVKSRTPAHLQHHSSHDRERAAVDLKRILRI